MVGIITSEDGDGNENGVYCKMTGQCCTSCKVFYIVLTLIKSFSDETVMSNTLSYKAVLNDIQERETSFPWQEIGEQMTHL